MEKNPVLLPLSPSLAAYGLADIRSMPPIKANSVKKPSGKSDMADAATLRLLEAMGLSAVRVSPGIVALTAKPAKR